MKRMHSSELKTKLVLELFRLGQSHPNPARHPAQTLHPDQISSACLKQPKPEIGLN